VKTQRSADIAAGCFLSILGLIVVFAAMGIKGGMDERLPPRTLPYVLGGTMIGAGVVLAFKTWRLRGKETFINWPDRAGAKRVLVTLVSLAIYIALIGLLGLPIVTLLFVSFLVWYLGRYRIIYSAMIGLISAAVVYFLFILFLELSFPVGPLAR
jgi:putative tricarboxylic transport membrane protein